MGRYIFDETSGDLPVPDYLPNFSATSERRDFRSDALDAGSVCGVNDVYLKDTPDSKSSYIPVILRATISDSVDDKKIIKGLYDEISPFEFYCYIVTK